MEPPQGAEPAMSLDESNGSHQATASNLPRRGGLTQNSHNHSLASFASHEGLPTGEAGGAAGKRGMIGGHAASTAVAVVPVGKDGVVEHSPQGR